MVEQPQLLSTGILGVAGLLLRGYVAQRDDHAGEIASAISSLEDEARNDMVVPLAELLVDVDDHDFEDGGDSDFSSSLGKWEDNDTIGDKKQYAMRYIFRVIQQDRADPGVPEEETLEELQEIRRDMHAGADLESARTYHDRVRKCEWLLKRSLEVVMILAVVGVAPRLAVWEQFVGVPSSQAIATANSFLIVTLVVAVALGTLSAVFHCRSKSLFEQNGIDL